MDTIIGLLTGGTGTWAIIGAVVGAVLTFIWKVFSTGRAVERGKAAERVNKGWVDASEVIGEAKQARRTQRRSDDADGGLYSNDGFKRKPPE